MLGLILIASTVLLLPSIQHFIPPLSYCLLADICNHTWIPDCGREDYGSQGDRVRMFIDMCDMYEFNCDFDRKFELTNYSECFRPATDCPTLPRPKFLRVGDYKIMERGRHMIYAPTTSKHTSPVQHTKRRYSRKPGKRVETRRTWKVLRKSLANLAPTRTTRTLETVVLKRISVLRGGKMVIKVVKGYPTTAKATKSSVAKDSKA